jgi:hypothetical protein
MTTYEKSVELPAEEGDLVVPWRLMHRHARRVATAVLVGSVAVVVAAATMPLWVADDVLHVPLVDVEEGIVMSWFWDLPVGVAWWALTLVLLAPFAATIVGLRRSGRRLAHAEVTVPQRAAEPRPRNPDEIGPVGRYALQHPARTSTWTSGGGWAALLPGGLVVVAVLMTARDLSDTSVGVWLAAAGWAIVLVGSLMWAAMIGIGVARRRMVRRLVDQARV